MWQPVPAITYAAIELEKEGIRCAVINARFIKPMDREMLIEAARKVAVS
jgi:transketolase C-terminal domain/subunit